MSALKLQYVAEKCELCDVESKSIPSDSEPGDRQVVQITMGDDKPRTMCFVCMESLPKEVQLEYLTRSICTLCGTLPADFKAHQDEHRDEAEPCPVCDEKQTDLNEHILKVHVRPVIPYPKQSDIEFVKKFPKKNRSVILSIPRSKFSGSPLSQIPRGYLMWIVRNGHEKGFPSWEIGQIKGFLMTN